MSTHLHIIFWGAVLAMLTWIFVPYFSSVQETFYFVTMLMPVVIGTCYFFNFYLVPKFLLTRKYMRFTLYCIYMLIISLYLEMVVILLSFVLLAQYTYDNLSPVSSDVSILAVTLYFIVLLFSFILLIKRSLSKEHIIENLQEENEKYNVGSFSVRSNRQMKTLAFDEVLYIESLSDYVKINLENGSHIITREKISHLKKRLPDQFIRIHRSFLINRQKVATFSKEEVQVAEQYLPVSRSYRDITWQILHSSSK